MNRIDPITINRIQTAHPQLRNELLQMYHEFVAVLTGKAIVRFAYVLRTYKEQDDLFAQGRTKPGKKVTNAPGGRSYHNFGLAFDIVLLKDNDGNGTFETASWETNVDFDGDGKADWQEIVAIARQYGWEWGGSWSRFPDAPHFQKTFGKSVVELDQKVKLKQVIPGTQFPLLQ
jgi:peptidoglycan L-alanyl-D-glutamate endopeptidase CwlK